MPNEPETTTNETAAPATTATVPAGYAVLDEVKGLVEKSGPEVRARVVAALAEKVVVDRVELVKRGLDKLNEARNNLRKVNKPDQTFIDGDGKKVELMTVAKNDEVKKAKEALEKIEKALDLALTKFDYTKLTESCK